MPQFDYSTYSSQIFWFLICFTILFFVSRAVILPRIKNILEERNKIIESNKLQSFEIENDIEKLNSKIKLIKSEASSKHQKIIEEAILQANKDREIKINEVKNKIDELNKKSNKEISSLLKEHEKNSKDIINEIIKTIKNKIIT